MANKLTWKFRLDDDHIYCCKFPAKNAISFKDEQGKVWLEILYSGTIKISAGYAWDGCSPKFKIGDLMLIGVPDGIPDEVTGLPITYYASLVHDALYQFLHDPKMPYTRAEIDEMFYDILLDAGFSHADLYYYVLRHLGGVFHFINNR